MLTRLKPYFPAAVLVALTLALIAGCDFTSSPTTTVIIGAPTPSPTPTPEVLFPKGAPCTGNLDCTSHSCVEAVCQ